MLPKRTFIKLLGLISVISWLLYNLLVRMPSITLPVESREEEPLKEIITEPQPQVEQVFYNRIPKTGSCSFRGMLRIIRSTNKFDVFDLKNEPSLEHRFHTEEQTVNFVKKYFLRNSRNRKSVVVKHLLFLDFDRVHNFNMTPLYINNVRSPVERFISNYNYLRYTVKNTHIIPKSWKELPIDDCINTRHVECTHPNSTMVMVRFFCGNDPICLIEGRAAVNIAKRNIEKHYITVGLLERRRDWTVVLEHLLPQFFTNFTQTYDELYAKKKTIRNITKWLQVPSKNETLQLKHLLRYDKEIYDFVAQRFNLQYKTIVEKKLRK